MTNRTILAIVVVVSTYSVSTAAEHKMTCKNPRHGYVAVFDDVANTFLVSAPGLDVAYQVERIEKNESGYKISGITADSGPDFTAYTGVGKRIDFLEDGTVIQTDECE